MENLGLKKLKRKVTFNETALKRDKTTENTQQSASLGMLASTVKKLEDIQMNAEESYCLLKREIEVNENIIDVQDKEISKLEIEKTEVQHKLEFERFAKTGAFQDIIKLRQQFNKINEANSSSNFILTTFVADENQLEENLKNNHEIFEKEKVNLTKIRDDEEEAIKLLSEEVKNKTSMWEENNLAAVNKKSKLSEISKTLTMEIENIDLKAIDEEQIIYKTEIEEKGNEIKLFSEEIEKQEKYKQETNLTIKNEELQYLKRIEEINIIFDDLNDGLCQSEVEYSRLDKQCTDQKNYNNKIQKEIDDLSLKVQKINQECDKIQFVLECNRKYYNKQEEAVKSSNGVIENKFLEKQNKYNEMMPNFNILEKKNLEIPAEVKHYENENTMLTQDVNNLEEKLSAINSSIIEQEKSSAEISTDIEEKKEKFFELKVKYELVSSQNEENAASFQNELREINEPITEREIAMNLEVQSNLQELEENKKDIETELKDINNDFSIKSNDLQVAITQLEKQKLLIIEENENTNNELEFVINACNLNIHANQNIENSNSMLLEVVKEQNLEASSKPPFPVVSKRSFDEFSDSSREGTYCTALQLQKIRKINAERKMMKESRKMKKTH